ncbi:protein mono-ADP-ribosyltransferase PARP14-like [Archocentrus centrarchus]|uniref:protein mono-ADP-ribosyltransferase PARP14-like n=1 Tax=Archocentrus centrarchus TaxID=63155 RepID=UPI0011EA18BF|nr:protein mono-ADP-ribosyltransferase PARP14-like [Archocentrus centrarchus]
MDKYKHPLFFEAKDLTDSDIEDIRKYFEKNEGSEGGECEIPGKVDGNTYKICFKDKEGQERALLRKFHTISLSGGKQCVLTTPTKVNTKCLEKIFKTEIFLLYYLRDNLKAFKNLQKQLFSLGCTVEFKFDEEEAVVISHTESHPGGCHAQKQEQQLEQIFSFLTESYLCYHVLEPKQIKMVLRDPSFKSDDIKVYAQSGYAVVVGEVHAVKEKIAVLEKSLSTKNELPVVEKQFKLVEEEFNREMRAYYPEVKINRDRAIITLEGPDNEVESGAAKLDELIKKIKEKRVQFPTALLTFVTTSGAISKYQDRFQQSLRNPVYLEVGSDLVLSSSSSDALNEAEAAVTRDFKVVTVELQGAAAVPPDLDRVKEILVKARNDANRREVRVDFSFMPGSSGTAATKVQVVGYSENVNKLKEALCVFQQEEVVTKEVVNLPFPELVDCFDKMLDLIGMKQAKVTLKPSHLPNPCVLVMGPQYLVQKVRADLAINLSQLSTDTLVLNGPGVQWYFEKEGRQIKEQIESSCQVLIREQQEVYSQSTATVSHFRSIQGKLQSNTASSPPNMTAVNKPILEIKLGSLEDQQVNVLVAPMISKKLTSTKVGKCLQKKAGTSMRKVFGLIAQKWNLSAGNVMVIDAPPSLGCSKIFFIECLRWDGVDGLGMRMLANGLKMCLELCVKEGWSSIAFPVIGPGIVLKFPQKEAIQVLTDSIHQFGLSGSCGSLHTIYVVIKPDYPDSEECYHEIHRHLSLTMNHRDQAIFKSLKSDLADITMNVKGGVALQMVLGDIINETTDAVVNSTDFTNFHGGVCKQILSVAGPQVEADLRNAKVKKGDIFKSLPGVFPCKAILHMCTEKDAGLIEQQLLNIIQICESSGYRSVAIPAIGAGSGELDPNLVAHAILQGVKTAASSRLLQCLTSIRLVLNKINVFLAFKTQLMLMFPSAVINTVSASQLLPLQQRRMPVNTGLSVLCTTRQQSVFLFLGRCRKSVNDAMTKVKDMYQAHCSTQNITKEQLADLTQDEIKDLQQVVETQGLHVQQDQHGDGGLEVSGLKDGVTELMQMLNSIARLRIEVRDREEDDLYTRVAWCILGHDGNWERLPKTANHNLEKGNIMKGIEDTQGNSWNVDLQMMEAKRGFRQTKLKRLENHSDFTLPLYWDSMAIGENLKVVTLEPSSAEYIKIHMAFTQTVQRTVKKIERLQNVHLRQAYEVQKKKLSEKNRPEGGAGEKLLYHGTSQDSFDSIRKDGFNRSFSGKNATAYGQGTYFAVNASYSASPTYSKPAADGSQAVFVAQVLTGIYTQGRSDMRLPPLRDNKPDDRYDSVVDRIYNPSMFIVFNDNQAYPDYLITFF